MFSRRIAFHPALVGLALFLWAEPGVSAAIWGIQPVANSGYLNGHNATSVALDSNGNPRIAYFEGSSRTLHYSEKYQGSWSDTFVDTIGGDTGRWVSLAVDAQDNPHISYNYNLDNALLAVGDLKYATRSGGNWTLETVDAAGITGEYTSIAIDDQGNPHISYYDNSNENLKYAHKLNGTWHISTVDSTGNVGVYTSLALDSQGHPHIAYQDVGGLGLRYASKPGSTWVVETVASFVYAIQLSMDLDSQDQPHIIYFDQSVNKTKYATKSSGMWTNTVASALGAEIHGTFLALKVDSQDVPHICYYDMDTSRIMYAVKNGNGGAYWLRDFVSTTGGIWNSIILDSGDHPHISYYSPVDSKVSYAVFTDKTSDFEANPGTTLLTLNAFPNPLHVSTTLVLRSPRTVPLDLMILDARGRVVRNLGNRVLPPGTSVLKWDGRDDLGSPVGSGVYFAVTRPQWLATSRKLVVVR